MPAYQCACLAAKWRGVQFPLSRTSVGNLCREKVTAFTVYIKILNYRTRNLSIFFSWKLISALGSTRKLDGANSLF